MAKKGQSQHAHGSSFSSNSSNTAPNSRGRKQEEMICVVVRGTSTLLLIPKADVLHMPADQKRLRLVLCDQFNPASPHSSCRHNAECRWVHADTTRATQKYIHVAWAWPSREEVCYPLMRFGRSLVIEQPSATREEVPADTVDSGMILRTRCVFDDPKRPASHCAHFYYGRECHLGPMCDFAHVIYIDPEAEAGKRAPPPFSKGRQGSGSFHSNPSKQTWSMRQEEGSDTPYADQSPLSTPGSLIQLSKGRRGTKGCVAAHQGSAHTTPWSPSLAADEAHAAGRSVTTRRLPYSFAASSYTPQYRYLEPGDNAHQYPASHSDYCEPHHAVEPIPTTPPASCRKVEVDSGDGVSRWRYDPYGLCA